MFTDQILKCVDCGQEFTFTAGEQEFYAQKGFSEPPKRCASCRAIRKAQRGNGGSRGYGDSSAFGGGYSASGGYGSGEGADYERRPRTFFEATCSNCGNVARLPFEPNGSRPVYCSDCFQSRRG
ncbi:MAG TPA: zinc-ribbon domain containing protein [Candidatus Limnocylindrales bacterium]|nr:zinc-ribbon domain containing protein [Candidatus Limnocylindrales bacterium]